MSRVTNVLVSHGILEGSENRQRLLEPIDGDNGQVLRHISEGDAADHWGGARFPEVDLYASALNYVSTDKVLDHVGAIPWEYPAEVMVLIQEQEDDTWSVYRRKNDDWQLLA